MPLRIGALGAMLLGCAQCGPALPQQQQEQRQCASETCANLEAVSGDSLLMTSARLAREAPAGASANVGANATAAAAASGMRSHIAMFFTRGCSGSSFAFNLTRELLELHGWRVWSPGSEMLKDRNVGEAARFCHERREGGQGDVVHTWNQSSWVARLQQAHAVLTGELPCSGEHEQIDSPTIFLVKGKDFDRSLSQDFVRWATPSSTSLTSLHRPNDLDHLICKLKDCFLDKEDDSGYPVDAHGARRDECFSRRKLDIPDEEYKVYINATWLQRYLRGAPSAPRYQDLAEQLSHKYGKIPVVTTADLFAYEYSPEPGALHKSVEAWTEQLRGLGASPRQDVISSHLQRLRQEGLRQQHSHSTEIYNWEEVKRVVMGAGERVSWMWRD